MKYYRAEMGGIEPWMWLNEGNLEGDQRGWTQQPDHWTLFFLEHSGGFIINNRVQPYEDGCIALVAPGIKAGFLRVGEDTRHFAFTFNFTKRVEVVALPSIAHFGEDKELRRREFHDAYAWHKRSIGRALACTYNVLWSVAQPSDVLRTSESLYDFERLILDCLQERLSVTSICAELSISHSHLLRLVRSEYGMTPQEYIRDKRTEVARNLIATTNLPLKTIASKVGMSDLQYFNKSIRSATGLSPRSLRDLAENRTRH